MTSSYRSSSAARPMVTRKDGVILSLELTEKADMLPQMAFVPPASLETGAAMSKLGSVLKEISTSDLSAVLQQSDFDKQRVAYTCGGLLIDFTYMRPGVDVEISYPVLWDQWNGSKELMIFRRTFHDMNIGPFEFIARGYSAGQNISDEEFAALRTMKGEAQRACGYMNHFVAHAVHSGITRYIER